MPDSVKLNEARERIKACHQELIDLETRAGIAETAEKLRDEPPNYLGVYDAAEPYSDEKRELEQAEEAFHQQRTTRRIRDLYFAVRDAELRKALVTKDREEGNLALRYWQQELSDTAARLDKARSTDRHWSVWAYVWGIALLAVGFYLVGLPGALGGLLVGYLNGRRMEHEAVRARESAVANTERELKEAEATWDEVRNQPQTFSQREAQTGEPDPKGLLYAL